VGDRPLHAHDRVADIRLELETRSGTLENLAVVARLREAPDELRSRF
jgi:hypothetical protein